MKILAKQNRELIMINAQNTQNENDAEKLTIQVPEQYQDFNKKIVFVTPNGIVWDMIINNEYLIKKAITKFKQVDFYIWLTKEDVDFRTQTKTLKFYHNLDASDEITDQEIGRVNTYIAYLDSELVKLETRITTAEELIQTIINTKEEAEELIANFEENVEQKKTEINSLSNEKIQEIGNVTEEKKEELNNIADGVKDMATAIQFATFEIDNNMNLIINHTEKLVNTNFSINDLGELEVAISG